MQQIYKLRVSKLACRRSALDAWCYTLSLIYEKKKHLYINSKAKIKRRFLPDSNASWNSAVFPQQFAVLCFRYYHSKPSLCFHHDVHKADPKKKLQIEAKQKYKKPWALRHRILSMMITCVYVRACLRTFQSATLWQQLHQPRENERLTACRKGGRETHR